MFGLARDANSAHSSSFGFFRIRSGSLGFVRVRSDSFGFARVRSDSFEFFSVLSGSLRRTESGWERRNAEVIQIILSVVGDTCAFQAQTKTIVRKHSDPPQPICLPVTDPAWVVPGKPRCYLRPFAKRIAMRREVPFLHSPHALRCVYIAAS